MRKIDLSRTVLEELPLADVLGGAGHVHGLPLTFPRDLHCTAVQAHRDRALGEARADRRYRRGARTGAARQRLARAALPDPHPHLVPPAGVGELDVRPFGEKGGLLDRRPSSLQVQRLDLLLAPQKGHGVRVAHRDPQEVEAAKLYPGVESGRSHVYPRGTVFVEEDLFCAGAGLHGEGVPIDDLEVAGVAGEAAEAVAAHLRGRAVGVQVDHLDVRYLGSGRHEYPVRPDSEVPVARFSREAQKVHPLDLAGVEDDKVVPDAVHLDKTHGRDFTCCSAKVSGASEKHYSLPATSLTTSGI